MMVTLLRSLSRAAALCLVAALAVIGLALAIFAIGGEGAISLPALARDLHLPGLLDGIGERLGRLEVTERPVAWLTLLAAAAAVLGGLLLLAGTLLRGRERLFVLEQDAHARLAVRRRPLMHLVRALALQTRGVTQARVKLRRRPRGQGGRLTVFAARSMTAADMEVVDRTTQKLAPLAGPFALQTRVRSRAGVGAESVE